MDRVVRLLPPVPLHRRSGIQVRSRPNPGPSSPV
jgi:hypothetical protein